MIEDSDGILIFNHHQRDGFEYLSKCFVVNKIFQPFFNHDQKICSGCFKSSCPQQDFRTLLLFNHNHKICLKMLSKFLAFFAMVMWVAPSSTAVIIIKLVFFGDVFPISLSNLVSPSQSNSLKMLVAILLTKPGQISPLPP